MFESAFSSILFWLLQLVCWAIEKVTQLFEVFSGLKKVTFHGEGTFLPSVFFNNGTINTIYWGMALIGMTLCFCFAIFAMARKMFDAGGKIQSSVGQILGDTLKTVLIIAALSGFMTLALTSVDVLLRQVNYLFQDATGATQDQSVEFTDDQLAAMGRVLLEIGNYSKTPSWNSRYNVNDCFNTIRPSLSYLKAEGVFDYDYPRTVTDANGKKTEVNTWQSVLQDIANSADLRYDLSADVYYENVMTAITRAVSVMQTDASFHPLQRFEKHASARYDDIPLDRIVFLSGTLEAANNAEYNIKPSFTDALRLPYYSGAKGIQDSVDVVNGKKVEYDAKKEIQKDFNISYTRFNYLVPLVLGFAVLISSFTMLLNLIARIFNMLFLYLIAPPVLAVRPLDGGGKTRQWIGAFVVQALGVFGNLIALRLLLIFVPLIYDPRLQIFESSPTLDYVARAVMLYAAYEAAKKANFLLSGILTDTGGMSSAQASDMSGSASKAINTGVGLVGGAVRTGVGLVSGGTSLAMGGVMKAFGKGKEAKSGEGAQEAGSALDQKLEAPRADYRYEGPSGSSAPGDISYQKGTVGHKSATVQGRVKGFEAQRGPDPFGAGERVESPEYRSLDGERHEIPKAPPMPDRPVQQNDPDRARRQVRMELNQQHSPEMRRQMGSALNNRAEMLAQGRQQPPNSVQKRAKLIEAERRRQQSVNPPPNGGNNPPPNGDPRRIERNDGNPPPNGDPRRIERNDGNPPPEGGGHIPEAPTRIQMRMAELEQERRRQREQQPEGPGPQPIKGGQIPEAPELDLESRLRVRREALRKQKKKNKRY